VGGGADGEGWRGSAPSVGRGGWVEECGAYFIDDFRGGGEGGIWGASVGRQGGVGGAVIGLGGRGGRRGVWGARRWWELSCDRAQRCGAGGG